MTENGHDLYIFVNKKFMKIYLPTIPSVRWPTDVSDYSFRPCHC